MNHTPWVESRERGCGALLRRVEGRGVLMHLVFTAGKGIYRHDAEGSDDMPVCGCRGLKHL